MGRPLRPLWKPVAGVYLYTDPARYGGVWELDSVQELQRPERECECEGAIQNGDGLSWESFRAELQGNLSADPGFSGPWVHALCATSYPAFFGSTSLDHATGRLAGWNACSAGLLAMAAVCAQSIALQSTPQAMPGWYWTERPVEEEGRSVDDFIGNMVLSECLRLCAERADCASLAHGPYGCHLKDRCVTPGDALAPAGLAPDYRTYYRTDGPCGGRAGPSGLKVGASLPSRLGEIQVFIDIAMQLVEHAAHCLDSSSWPFSVAEVLDNRVAFVEASLGDRDAKRTSEFRWLRATVQTMVPLGGLAPVEADGGAVRWALDRLLIRWVRGLNAEVGFWHALLDPASKESPNVDKTAWDGARHWLATGDVNWHYGDVCRFVSDSRVSSGGRLGPPRILNVGSGPLAPAPLRCDDEEVPVASADGLARFYMQLYDILGHRPPFVPVQCPAESLHRCFPRNHFDVVHIRNALDHAGDPLLGIQQMLEVLRPGGWLLLRHARNEGVPGQFQLGLHQWAFDVVEGGDGASHFVVWNPSLRADVSAWLSGMGLAAEIQADLRAHPGDGVATEQYVWVNIRKPR